MRRSAAPSKMRSTQFIPPIRSSAIKRPPSPEDDPQRKLLRTSQPDNRSSKTYNSNNIPVLPTTTTRYFFVMWCKLSKKKHKTWEGDALLMTSGRTAILKDMEGKEIARASGIQLKVLAELADGSMLAIGGKEVEIQSTITAEEYTRKRHCDSPPVESIIEDTVAPKTKFKPFCLPLRAVDKENNQRVPGKPLHDVSNSSSIVLPRPPSGRQLKDSAQNVQIVDVVVDPFLGGKLRPHQKTGVSFLYEAVMNYRLPGFYGCILADEMGMGKSLQCISLIWTLLRQGPYGGKPVIRKALIATPSSLTANWKKEFDKWLGTERINVYVVDQKNKIEGFQHLKNYPVLIVSYEMLVRSVDLVNGMNFDVLLCDEGHRLKNLAIKTTSLLNSLAIKKRVIITGTPIQNDLQELHGLVEFVNPGILGTPSAFRKRFEDAIIKSKQPNVSAEAKIIGDDKAYELNRLLKKFTLRRTQEMLNKYLPPKNEYVVFCRPMEGQCQTYDTIIKSRVVQQCIEDVQKGDHLVAINALRKVCNHPLLLAKQDTDEGRNIFRTDLTQMRDQCLEENSGKLAVLSCMLHTLHEREKVVIVSHFTSTLDVLQDLCAVYNYSFLRLDGSTVTAARQQIVNRFNSKSSSDFILLLSAKAGGVGLNLIGSSRIILYDIDWNPATDLQSMARIWRDGQKREVHIYRLLLSGSIEEKIYQRQICKQGIGGSIVDSRKNAKNKFSTEELKDLFNFDPNSICLTHALLNCPCEMDGRLAEHVRDTEKDCQSDPETTDSSSKHCDPILQWQHFKAPIDDGSLQDFCLESGADFITFVFKCRYNADKNGMIVE